MIEIIAIGLAPGYSGFSIKILFWLLGCYPRLISMIARFRPLEFACQYLTVDLHKVCLMNCNCRVNDHPPTPIVLVRIPVLGCSS